ncbi:MAG: chromosome segregation protein SMC [Chloroflexi bacterium]|nr:chromosome segregation protein SMC [Chloroflexota bacterium]
MRLKKLVLQGYKTFASKTEFVFDEGITAVVGPNGSGKSNVADAVRWVLGEQSYGALRGKRTTDMIFAGSQTRPRAGMAQAILTLDNADGWLPIDYTEVEIGRRAYRSGENEYILNGQKVRLKDITDLLATSGLAERTYTIIGQGLVDQALSLRAEERRALFEEAAGINHYKSRRAETLRRLTETQHNLERVHDILAEIGPRMNSLKRQAVRARNYEQVAADLHHLLRIWYGYKWEQAKREMRRARETAVATEKIWQDTRLGLLAQQDKIDTVRRRLNQLQEQTAVTRSQRDDIRDQLEKARRQVAILQERQESLQRQLADTEQELPELEQQQQRAQTELAAATAELETAQASLQQNQTELRQFNANFQQQQTEINHWQKQLAQAEQEQRATQTRLAQAEGQLSQLQERLREQTAVAATTDSDEIATLEARFDQLTAVLTSAQERADELGQTRAAILDERQTLIATLKKLRAAAHDQQQQLNQRRNQLARLEARADMLDQMRRKETKLNGSARTLGQLASLVTIPAAHETAVAAALAGRLAALVLPDSVNLWQLLQSNDRQALTAVALDHLQAPPQPDLKTDPAVIGWANQLVTGNPIVKPVLDLLLGPILLVKDAESAYRLALTLPPGALAVSPDGFIAYAGGLVETGGADNQNSLLAREAEWRAAKADSDKLRAELDNLETDLSAAQAAIDEKQTESDRLQNEERRLARLQNEAAQRLAQAQRDQDRVKQQQTFLQRQQATRQQETERLQTRIAALQQEMTAGRETAVTFQQAVTTARASLEALPIAEAQQQRQTLHQQMNAASTIVAGRQAVVDSRRATLNQVERQLARLRERQLALRSQQAQNVLSDEEQTLLARQKQLAELDAALEPLQMQVAHGRKEMMALEEETAVLQKQAHDKETQYTQAKINLSQQQNAIEGLQERIKADIGLVALSYDEDQTGPTPLPIDEVVEQLPVVDELPGDIAETIQNYRAQMQRMGAINPDAPTEYETVSERFEFLTQQVEDLTQTDAQLRKVIEELDELTSRAFADTVDKVNAVFGDTFTQLFGGGAARLILTDPDDLTISGVDIIARLPNRREQGLGLLSGGERSLTAAALIFSLLKVSPTPFCVMDEVDAALDEANVNRFRDLLQELSLKSQFIVITHNRGTVQAAQTIYGISMGTDSASQVISIKPEDYMRQKSLI